VKFETVPTYTVTVYIAGDIETARRWLRRECYQAGLCVTATPTTFIYTGGEEAGFAVGFVNYPRFPSTPEEIWARAVIIAGELTIECCQRTALVVATDQTRWVHLAPPGAKS